MEKGGAEKKKKIVDACEGADSSTAWNYYGVHASKAVALAEPMYFAHRVHLLHTSTCTSLRSPEVVLRTCRYWNQSNEGRRYPQLAESRHDHVVCGRKKRELR